MNAVRRWFSSPLVVAALLAPLAATAPAAAQDMAEVLFNRGLAEMEAGKYATGCPAIAESQRIDPRPGTLFTLAVCESRWGRVASAATHFSDYLALFEKLTLEQQARQKERPKVAREELERLRPEIPQLTISLPSGAPVGTVVRWEGVEFRASALGVPLSVDPGVFTLSTQAPGGPVSEQRVTIMNREKRQVMLEVRPAPQTPQVEVIPIPPPPATQPHGKTSLSPQEPAPRTPVEASDRSTAAYVIGGVGGVGLVVGGLTGALALGEKGVINDHCGSAIGSSDEAACDPTGLNAADNVKKLGLVSTIGFGVGLAGVGTAVVLLLTEPKAPPSNDAHASRRLRLNAGVLSAGPEGAVLGARGSW